MVCGALKHRQCLTVAGQLKPSGVLAGFSIDTLRYHPIHCLQHDLLVAFCDSLDHLRQQTALSADLISASEQLLLEQLKNPPHHSRPITTLPQQQLTVTAAVPELNIQAPCPRTACTWGVHNSSSQADSPHVSCSSRPTFNSNQPAARCCQPNSNTAAGLAAGDTAAAVGDDDAGTVPAAPAGDPLYLYKLCILQVGSAAACLLFQSAYSALEQHMGVSYCSRKS